MTVVAFHIFAIQRVDVAVIEVGLGGVGRDQCRRALRLCDHNDRSRSQALGRSRGDRTREAGSSAGYSYRRGSDAGALDGRDRGDRGCPGAGMWRPGPLYVDNNLTPVGLSHVLKAA